MPKCVIFDVRSTLGVQSVIKNFSLYMFTNGTGNFSRSAKLAFSSFSKPFCLHTETVILVIIFTADRQLYSLTYVREICALSNKLSSTVGTTFRRKTQFVQLSSPPCTKFGTTICFHTYSRRTELIIRLRPPFFYTVSS